MLALKTAGELVASCLRFLVIKTETALFKRDEPKHVKKKTFFAACVLMATLHVSVAASATHLEEWSFMEGLYAWFITFTTIGFGDYVPFESFVRKFEQGKISKYTMIVDVLILVVPSLVGLSLTSCILSCIVDCLDEIRDFRNHYLNCCSPLVSAMKTLLCGKCSSYNMTEERNQDHGSSCENDPVN